MPATILIGAQWGDEGKGRIADWLSAEADIVARYAGGDNAGHTVRVGSKTFKLHLIPSGMLHDSAVCVLGAGTVINPVSLVREMAELRENGVVVIPKRLLIDARAHIITPAHVALDGASETALGKDAIGTTKRGIGPAYTSKAARSGIRAHQMEHPEAFGDLVEKAVEQANRTLEGLYGQPPLDAKTIIAQYVDAARQLQPFLVDTVARVQDALEAGQRVLCEGAQGTLLDLDFGTYPYVTSSHPTAGGALTGLGFGPKHVDRVIGAAKAFSTRVGGGPFPTEVEGALAERLRGTGENPWDEFGATTGRPRRCGWLDVVMLRYSVRVNGLTELIVNKFDVLSGLESLKIAVAYEINGQRVINFPYDQEKLAQAVPIYEELPGWSENVSQARHISDLPEAARRYIQRIEQLVGVPVTAVGVGPARDQVAQR